MKIQTIINSIFRQDFTNPFVLARTLFGLSMAIIGLLNVFRPKSYAAYAPDYLPMPEVLSVGIGVILLLTGFAVFANLYLKRAAQVLVLLFASFIVIVDLPTGNILWLAQDVAFISTALLIHALVKEKETKEEI